MAVLHLCRTVLVSSYLPAFGGNSRRERATKKTFKVAPSPNIIIEDRLKQQRVNQLAAHLLLFIHFLFPVNYR